MGRWEEVVAFVRRSSPTVLLLCAIIAAADVLLFFNYVQDVEDSEPPLPSNDFRRLVHSQRESKVR